MFCDEGVLFPWRRLNMYYLPWLGRKTSVCWASPLEPSQQLCLTPSSTIFLNSLFLNCFSHQKRHISHLPLLGSPYLFSGGRFHLPSVLFAKITRNDTHNSMSNHSTHFPLFIQFYFFLLHFFFLTFSFGVLKYLYFISVFALSVIRLSFIHVILSFTLWIHILLTFGESIFWIENLYSVFQIYKLSFYHGNCFKRYFLFLHFTFGI